MFCYDPDIAQLEACWLSVKRAFKEKRITTDKEAVEMFLKAFNENHNRLSSTHIRAKSRLNGAMFVALIRSLLPADSEETSCESMCEIFQDMSWLFYLKLVNSLELELELRDCLCHLDEKIFYDVVDLITDICNQEEELKISRIPNSILGSIFVRNPSIYPPKKCYKIISTTALWLIEIKPEEIKDFHIFFGGIIDTLSAFADMLLTVIGDRLQAVVGQDYIVSNNVPKIRYLKPFNSAKHWIHMARLFHHYICPYNWYSLINYSSKMTSIHFLLRCTELFNTDILHPMKKPKLTRVFRKQDTYSRKPPRNIEEEQKDIDDCLENVEELLKNQETNTTKHESILFLQTFVSKHVVYKVMHRLLIACTKANENSKAQITLHFLNMCEQSLLSPNIILQLYLDVCQGSELLKQPDFSQEITTFLNQTTEAHNLDNLVSPMVQLCLQSPKHVVYNIIHRALDSKGHIPTLAKLLSKVSVICQYKEVSQPSTGSLLVSSLKGYANKASSPKQVENLSYFVQELVKCAGDALDLSEFTSVVIVPLLKQDSHSLQTDLACQLLHLVLDSSPTALNCDVRVLAVTLLNFANRYLNSAELSKMDKFLSLLKKVESQVPREHSATDLEWLKKQLKDAHPVLHIRAADMFSISADDFPVQGINNLEKGLLQTTCIKGDGPTSSARKHLSSLPQAVRYAALIAALSKVLPVISQPEWLSVLLLVNTLLNDIFEENSKQKDNEATILTLRATTDALIVHEKNSTPTNWNYILSAYGQAVKHYSLNLADGEHLSYAFCEVCRLANALPVDASQYLLVSLLQLAGQALSSPQKEWAQTLNVAVSGISNDSLKASLQAKLENNVTNK